MLRLGVIAPAARRIYTSPGPEGCGKSRLFLEAVRMFGDWFDDGLAVYVNAEEARDPGKIFYVAVGMGVKARALRILWQGLLGLLWSSKYRGSLAGSAVALAIAPILDRLYVKLKLRAYEVYR